MDRTQRGVTNDCSCAALLCLLFLVLFSVFTVCAYAVSGVVQFWSVLCIMVIC